jgi:hypothetical protein
MCDVLCTENLPTDTVFALHVLFIVCVITRHFCIVVRARPES